MSSPPIFPSAPSGPSSEPPVVSPRPQGSRGRGWQRTSRTVAAVVLLLVLGLGGIVWYANTASFQGKVRQRLIASIEQATGGRVELGGFQWHLFQLEAEATDLTIHGLEAPEEVPYLHVAHLLVRARILSLLRPSVGLSLLRVERPVLHLIVNPDGTTNQPAPKIAPSKKPISDTLLDLAVERADILQGLVLINERSIPFDLAADKLGVQLQYSPASSRGDGGKDDHYSATITVADLMAHRRKEPVIHSRLEISLDLRRNQAHLQSLRLHTGATVMNASGWLTNFASPHWEAAANGAVELREVEALTGIEGLDHGLAKLSLHGQGDAKGQFALDGKGRVEDGSFTAYALNITGVNASATVHATETELRIENAIARLKQGGSVDGTLRVRNWLSSAATAKSSASVESRNAGTGEKLLGKTAGQLAKPVAAIRARVTDVSLRAVLEMTAPRQFRDLGFDTAATGNVAVDWTGSAADLTLDAQLNIAPPLQLDAGEVPVTGALDAKYFNRNGTVQITSLVAQTPATHLQVAGALGVYPVDQPSQLQGTLRTSNLGEFNQTLTDLGLTANGKTGTKAIPVELHGQAEFQGSVTGTVTDPDVKGHLTATNFGFALPLLNSPASESRTATAISPVPSPSQPSVINWDRLDADAEYTPRLLSVQAATIVHGKTMLHLAGQLHAHQAGKAGWRFDEHSSVDATIGIQKGSVTELLALAGESTVPVTGTLDMSAHVAGSLDEMNGGGHLTVAGGEILSEPYRRMSTDIVFAGHEVSLSNLSLLQNGGELMGGGSYDVKSKMFRGTAQGRGFELAHIRQAQTGGISIGGLLEFDASGEGTLQNPTFQAKAHLSNLVVGEQAMGDLQAVAHTEQHSLRYTVDSSLKLEKMHLAGATDLAAPNVTRAEVTLSQFDIDPLLQLAKVPGLSGHSSIAGSVKINGPLAQPKQLGGEAELSQLAVNVASVALKSEGRVHATLQNGALHLDPLHITGEETDLRAQGSVDIFGHHDLNLHAQGSVNLKLAQSINPDVSSSGQVDFGVDALGTVEQPSLTGQIKFVNVAMALQDLPNGLSQMNGTLQFNQDRLEVKELTASTGGGQLKLGGYLTYRRGLYGDMTATGKGIRIRYPQGISSVADASLHLQGQPANMLLSGNIIVTRFAISPDLDIAGLAGSANAVSAPTADSAPSNHVRLDVTITSAPQLNFQNSLAKLAGDVDLRVRGTVANPSLLGRVNITEGSATFAGTQYQLQRGDIYFTNPVRIEPNIDVDATARVEEYDINIGVHGTPANLNISYRSEPPLPQADVIALLAIGRTQDEQRIYSQQQQAAGVNPTTDALLSGALNATVSNRVQKLFGVGSVKIDPTFVGTLGTATARITVEQQVAKNVLVTYATNVNTTAQQLIQAQVNLTRNVSVVAVRDESGVFSMVLKVHKRIR